MKRKLLVALPLLILTFGFLKGEAASIDDMLAMQEVTNPVETQDLTGDLANLSTQKRTRSGETEFTISYEDLEGMVLCQEKGQLKLREFYSCLIPVNLLLS